MNFEISEIPTLLFYTEQKQKMKKTNGAESIIEDERPTFIKSVRFLTAVIIFFGYCFQYMIKINLSIGEHDQVSKRKFI